MHVKGIWSIRRFIQTLLCSKQFGTTNMYVTKTKTFFSLQIGLKVALNIYVTCTMDYVYTSVVSRAFMAGAASHAGDADSSRAPGLTSGLQGSVNVHRGALLLVPQWQCISSFVFYIVLLSLKIVLCHLYNRKIKSFVSIWYWIFFSSKLSKHFNFSNAFLLTPKIHIHFFFMTEWNSCQNKKVNSSITVC